MFILVYRTLWTKRIEITWSNIRIHSSQQRFYGLQVVGESYLHGRRIWLALLVVFLQMSLSHLQTQVVSLFKSRMEPQRPSL